MSRGRVLIIAGSDPGGGAGIQGDIKTVTVLSGYAMTAITALTVQNTLGVTGVHPVPPAFVAAQIAACLSDIGADAVKIGMLGDAATIGAVADALEGFAGPVVLDPVMIAKGGAALLAPDAVTALSERLMPRATVVTPNAPELAALTGMLVGDRVEALAAGEVLLGSGVGHVLVKGGHLIDAVGVDWLLSPGGGRLRVRGAAQHTRHTHGTGCAMASALATGLAQGMALAAAFERAHAFVNAAIQYAPGFGGGHGPLGFQEGARAMRIVRGEQVSPDRY